MADVAVAGTPTSAAGSPNTTSVTFAWNNSAAAEWVTVGVSAWDAVAADCLVSGVTYNGVAMTKHGEFQDVGNNVISIWKLQTPAAGSNNVVVTMGGSCSEFIAGAIGFINVNVGTPFGAFTSAGNAGGSTNPAQVTGVPSQTGALVLGVGYTNADPTPVGTPQWEINAFTSTWGVGQTVAGAASVTVTWTVANTSWAVAAMSINPTGGAGDLNVLIGEPITGSSVLN